MDHQGRLAEAREHYEKALAASRVAGDRRLEGGVLGNLGGLQYDIGEFDFARSLIGKSLQIAEEVGDARWKGNAHCNLGLLCLDQGELREARRHLDAAISIARQMGNGPLEYTVLCNVGLIDDREGNLNDAVNRFQEATTMATRATDRRAEGQFRGYLAAALAKQGRLGEARQCLDLAEALLTEVADQLSYALVMCRRSELELDDGNVSDAAHALRKARAIAATLEAGPESELGRSIAKIEAHLVAATPPLSC